MLRTLGFSVFPGFVSFRDGERVWVGRGWVCSPSYCYPAPAPEGHTAGTEQKNLMDKGVHEGKGKQVLRAVPGGILCRRQFPSAQNLGLWPYLETGSWPIESLKSGYKRFVGVLI